MNHAVYELLVPRLPKASDRILQVLLIIIIAALAVGTLIFGPILFLIAIVIGVVSYLFIFPRFHVEYEYTLLNHDLDIDIIYNRSKRKPVISFNLKEAEIIAPAKSHRLDSYRNMKTLDYSAQDPKNTAYAVIISMNQDLNRILIQPDDTMLEHMQSFLPRTFYKD